MKRRQLIAFLFVLMMLFSIAGCNAISPYDKLAKSSPKNIKCDTTTLDSVDLLAENVLIVSDDSITHGVASFRINDSIYMLGHKTPESVGSFVVKADKSNKIETSNLIGEVVSNGEDGVIAKQLRAIREYSSIPIAKTVQLGDAFIIGRDEEGSICRYAICIDAFKENQNIFLYSSSEIEFINGTSGSPIVQNGELIGIHYASTDDGKIGVGKIIWNLDIVHP